MKKQIFISMVLFTLLTACGGGGGGASAPAPNSITSSAVSINSGWSGGTSPIDNITTGASSGLSALSNGNIWLAQPGGQTNWTNLGQPGGVAAATTSASPLGVLYAANTAGNVYSYTNNVWAGSLNSSNYAANSLSSGTEANPSTMLVVGGNNIYLGNQSGHLWYYNATTQTWAQSLAANGFSPDGGITQLAVDNIANPAYLGVATGSYVWACQIASGGTCSAWKNLVQTAINNRWYTDANSTVNAIAFYRDTSGNQYGYIGNANGNVWRAVYTAGSVSEFANMTSNSQFPGYSGTGQITSMAVSVANVLYVGTSGGQVYIFVPSKSAWSNITPTGNSSPITALVQLGINSVLVGNSNGQMWNVTWQ